MGLPQASPPDPQISPPSSTSQVAPLELNRGPINLKSIPRDLFVDQKKFWTAPFHTTKADVEWAIPIAIGGLGLVATDTEIEKRFSPNADTIRRATTASNAGLALMGAGAGSLFLWGRISHDDQMRETGLLAGEAGVDAFLETEVLSYATGRSRPLTPQQGKFFTGGDSFPSQHAAISWAIASVIAHEYPGPLTQVLSYGLAGGISAARFAAQKHFASEILLGSVLGWYTGRQVFRSRSHYSDEEIARYGTFKKDEIAPDDAADAGSPYVPLDSWIYPAMQRLIALGFIRSADLGMRPWTRMECARLLLREAGRQIAEDGEVASEPQKLYSDLSSEFRDEYSRLDGASNRGVSIDSLYTRATQISGEPLHDSLHFGQTIMNDYGRPYGRGFNNATGVSGHAVYGPFFGYLRAEYQHALGVPAFSMGARQAIRTVDGIPVLPPDTPSAQVNKIDFLEGYIGLQLSNWQFTFGKQALWWGEDSAGPMLFSNNSAPLLMLQINRVKPFTLPSIFRVIGPIRISYFVGRATGYRWVYSSNNGFSGSWTNPLGDQPFVVGEKLSFKPSANLELGFSLTCLTGGSGVPFTTHKLLQATFSTGNGAPGTSSDPGDHRGGFDFAYRIPKLRDWLTLYGDAFTDDDKNPWFGWADAAVTSGLYLARVPKIPKLDFRVEGIYTDLPWGSSVVHEPGFFYFNDRFKSGYTNGGNLIGSWIGREGQGAEAWSNFWFTPKNKLQVHFRHQKVSREFIPDGGTLTDIGLSGDYWFRSNLGLSASLQYERWLFPIVQAGASRNTTAQVEFFFSPRNIFPH